MSKEMPNYEPVISVCIPTYNRANKVELLVKNILAYQGNDIEVVVLDNSSTDDTINLLSKIRDHRFSLHTNTDNIGGQMNQLKVLTLAKAKYAFFCLDKDKLDGAQIGKLLARVTENADVVFGYCALNIDSEANDVIYDRGFSSVINMAYLSQHPTGIFYDAAIYRNLGVLKKIMDEKKHFPFYPDLINGEMAMEGKSRKINLPAFYTETKEECRTVVSFTYNEKNIFFSPENRLQEFDQYVSNLQRLKLTNAELYIIIKKLYNRILHASTFEYRTIMHDADICAHHGMTVRTVGPSEIWNANIKFARYFLDKPLPVTYYSKLKLIAGGHVKTLIKLVLLR
jgi:glycosyltransferase involved in cell wall biosynthesis